jgi:glycolate oxidase iron-sulfur subunit
MSETVLSRPSGGGALAALADRCVQCGLCLPHCPTYRLDATETESPRGRIAYAKAVATGLLAPTALGDLHLDHCLGCRRCEGACPAGVEYGSLLVAAREEQAKHRPIPVQTRRLLWWLAHPRLLAGALRAYRLAFAWLPQSWRRLPRPPALPAPDRAPRDFALEVFVGCIARTYEAPARAALSRLLGAMNIRMLETDGQACCGAAAEHAGDGTQAAALAARNQAAFQRSGGNRVLCLASGCEGALGHSLEGVTRVQDVLHFLNQNPRTHRLRFRNAGGRRVALHRPCTQFALAGNVAQMRELLARVPGLEVLDLPDRGCCGAAGLHMLQFPQRAQALAQPVLRDIEASGATEVISANVGCRLHLGGGKLPVRHPLELLAEFLE